MKKIQSVNFSFKAFLISLLALALLLPLLASCSSAKKSGALLSPALDCIAEQNSMAKSTLKGNALTFSPEDFARAVNSSDIDSITLTSLPPLTHGELRVGSTVISGTQTLSAASIALMTFHASDSITRSEFRFRVDDSPYEMCCKLYILDEQNYAPTLSSAPKTALEVSTHESVTYFGTLPCYDPDGDSTFIEVVSYPEKGLLIIDDKSMGTYRYIPYENSTGKDSFTCVARDIYGNYSASANISLKINKTQTPTIYVDLADSPYHNSALTMTEKNIMSGTQVGTSTYFYPDKAVSRAEFVVMAMNAAGIKEVNPSTETVFSDNADIPSDMRSYIAAAYELGYIKGSAVDGRLCFEPNREITRAEAAVMLANMLDAATPTITPVFSDSSDIPTWAQASIYSLSYLGVLESDGGNISPTASVTRGDAADILCNFMAVKE